MNMRRLIILVTVLLVLVGLVAFEVVVLPFGLDATVRELVDNNPAVLSKSLWTVIVGVLIYSVYSAIRKFSYNKDESLGAKHKFRKATIWTATAAYILVLLMIWISDAQNLGMFLGIIGAGIAMSLQEVFLGIAGWALVVIKKPFDIGDRIEVNGIIGDVIDIRLFQTSLMEVGNWVHAEQSTGRMVNIPNSKFITHETSNYTQGFPFIWNELEVIVTFESDWQLAKEIILDQALEESEKVSKEVQKNISKMQSKYAIQFKYLTPIVYTGIAEEGALLTLRYLSPVRGRRGTSHKICEGILKGFGKQESIDFAYPTTRFFDNRTEGKPGKAES